MCNDYAFRVIILYEYVFFSFNRLNLCAMMILSQLLQYVQSLCFLINYSMCNDYAFLVFTAYAMIMLSQFLLHVHCAMIMLHYTVRVFTVCMCNDSMIMLSIQVQVLCCERLPLKTMATDPVARTRQVWVIYIYNGSVLHIKLGLNQRHQAGYSSVIRYKLLK